MLLKTAGCRVDCLHTGGFRIRPSDWWPPYRTG